MNGSANVKPIGQWTNSIKFITHGTRINNSVKRVRNYTLSIFNACCKGNMVHRLFFGISIALGNNQISIEIIFVLGFCWSCCFCFLIRIIIFFHMIRDDNRGIFLENLTTSKV